jgi:transposase-like protein
MASEPKTLQQAILYFDDFENCKQFMIGLRWPTGKIACPRCGAEKVTWLEKPRVWKCYAKHEKPTFTLKTGTIFEDSPIALEKWLPAVWLIVTCKNGISSYEISRDLGISQKSAWHMAHRIRFALHTGSFDKLSGQVEVDETYVGGKARNMHKSAKKRRGIGGTGPQGKAIVLGILERKGKVRTHVVPTSRRKNLFEKIHANVEAGSEVFTDSHPSYFSLGDNYEHQVIDHAKSYVEGNIHTNGLENFWSLLKRGINGTYVSVEPFHLFRYVDEQAYRYNHRKDIDGNALTDFDRFKLAMTQVVGKRLTWDQLTGKNQDLQTRSIN